MRIRKPSQRSKLQLQNQSEVLELNQNRKSTRHPKLITKNHNISFPFNERNQKTTKNSPKLNQNRQLTNNKNAKKKNLSF